MASLRQRSSITLTPSNASTISLNRLDLTISGLNDSLEFLTPPLRGTPLVDLLDFLNTHYDSLRLILSPNDADKATMATFPADFEELRVNISAELCLLLGPHAFNLFLHPESDNAKKLWDSLMKGVDYKVAMSENHARWAKVNPNKIYALFEGSDLHYHFSQPGHAEANVGYGVPLWVAHGKPRSPEFQAQSDDDKSEDDTEYTVSIDEAETPTSSRRSSFSIIFDDTEDEAVELYPMVEFYRPPLRELHPSEGNVHPIKDDDTDFELFAPQAHSENKLDRLEELRELRVHKEIPRLASLASLDLHTASYRPVQEDLRGRQEGHHNSAGLLFGETLPSTLVTIPSYTQLLGNISDDDLQTTAKEWPSAEADQFQKRFAYESCSLAGAKSFLTDLSRLPDDKFVLGEDIIEAMMCKFINDGRCPTTGSIPWNSMVNRLVVMTNIYIARGNLTHVTQNPGTKEELCETVRNFLSELGVLEFSSAERADAAAAAATLTKQMSLARECRVISKGLREAHFKVEDCLSGARCKKSSGRASRSPITNTGKKVGKQGVQPENPMIFFR